MSDLVPLKDRGKYQGFISAATSTGNAIGPFVGGGLASIGQWRWLFRYVPSLRKAVSNMTRLVSILGLVVIVMDHFILPLKPVTGDIKEKIRRVDYIGIFLSAAATVLLLVPISGGGSTFAWNSALVIALLVVGAVCGIVFVVHEIKFTRLPILPSELRFAVGLECGLTHQCESSPFGRVPLSWLNRLPLASITMGYAGPWVSLHPDPSDHLLYSHLPAIRQVVQRACGRRICPRVHLPSGALGYRRRVLHCQNKPLQKSRGECHLHTSLAGAVANVPRR